MFIVIFITYIHLMFIIIFITYIHLMLQGSIQTKSGIPQSQGSKSINVI